MPISVLKKTEYKDIIYIELIGKNSLIIYYSAFEIMLKHILRNTQ